MRHLTMFVILGSLFAACGSGAKPKPVGSGSGGGSGTSGGTSGGAAGSSPQTGAAGNGGAGIGGGAGTGGGGSTTAGVGGGGTTGAAGTGAAGSSNPDAAPMTDGNAGDLPTAGCAPGAIFCEGFEQYPILPNPYDPMGNSYNLVAMGDTAPTWLSYHFHGPPRVDASKPFKGKQNFHLDTESGHTASSDIIKEAPDGVDLWPAAHYGRVMVWLKSMPPTSAWGIMTEQGLLAGSTTDVAQYTLGGSAGKLAFTYTQRKRVVKNDVSSPSKRRGGDAQPADPAPVAQCRITAAAEALPIGKWVCVEWMVDRTKSELHMWLDGQAQTEVDVVGKAGTCSIGTPATWQGPEHFTELDLGWEIYGNDGGGSWEAWYDEFAIGTQRLNCPMP
jgi:hypothetical protein